MCSSSLQTLPLSVALHISPQSKLSLQNLLDLSPRNVIWGKKKKVVIPLCYEPFSLTVSGTMSWMAKAGAQRPTIEFLDTAAPRTACK